MRTISTKAELKEALKARERKIIVTGDLAAQMRKKTKVKKAAKIGGLVLIIGGTIAIPFTAGASAGAVAMGLSVTALTIGSVTLSTGELIILCGFSLGLLGVLTGAKVTFGPGGTVTIEPRYSK